MKKKMVGVVLVFMALTAVFVSSWKVIEDDVNVQGFLMVDEYLSVADNIYAGEEVVAQKVYAGEKVNTGLLNSTNVTSDEVYTERLETCGKAFFNGDVNLYNGVSTWGLARFFDDVIIWDDLQTYGLIDTQTIKADRIDTTGLNASGITADYVNSQYVSSYDDANFYDDVFVFGDMDVYDQTNFHNLVYMNDHLHSQGNISAQNLNSSELVLEDDLKARSNSLELCRWEGPYGFGEEAVCSEDKLQTGIRLTNAGDELKWTRFEIRCCEI